LTKKMNILFVHNNFPAQYRFLIRALTREEGHNLVAVGSPTARAVKGVKLLTYAMDGADVCEVVPVV
jgi:hypothetical protein